MRPKRRSSGEDRSRHPCVPSTRHQTMQRKSKPSRALIEIMSPSRIRAMGPPWADSGPTCPTQKPRVAPEKPAVGYQGDLLAHALSRKSGGGREHLSHARASSRALIPDHDDFAFLVISFLDRSEGIFLAFEHTGRTGKLQLIIAHAGNLHNCSVRSKVALEADDSTCR